MKQKTFTSILILTLISLSSIISSDSETTALEKELLLKEQQSKIEQIKYVNNEIESQISKRTEASLKEESQAPKEVALNKKVMNVNSDFAVTGGITANKFYSETATITGSATIGHILKSEKVNADQITSQTVIVEKISSTTGVLTIMGDLIINNDVMAETVNMRGSSFIVEGVKQWGLVHHDDFESEKSLEGWSDKRTSRCKNGSNTMLGGHCNFSFHEVSKVFKNLPPHEKIRINAAFHMLDSWDGEYAYMKVDGVKVWTKRGQHSKDKGVDICGGDFNDPAFNIPIDATLSHTGTEVTVTFGSTLDEEPCNESFGVDDVMLYVR